MVEHYLRYVDAAAPGAAASFFGWVGSPEFVAIWADGTWSLHLWFLVSLMPMFLLAGLVQAGLPANSRLRGLSVKFSDRLATLFAGSAAFALFLLLLAGANTANYAVAGQIPGSYQLIFPGFQSWYKLVSEFPFFVIGVMAALSPALLKTLVTWRPWMPFAAAAALYFQPYANPDQGMLESLAMLFANQLSIWVLVLFILQFFHRFFLDGGPKTSWLADCALSMYLFHHCLVYIYGRWLVPVDWPIALEFTLLTVAAAGTVIMIHEFAVRRIGWVRLLFNGKTDIEAIRARRAKQAGKNAPLPPAPERQAGALG